MAIQAITFDFWSTLYHYRQSPRAKHRQIILDAFVANGRYDINEKRLSAAMKQATDRWDHVWRTEQRTLDANEILTLILDIVGVTLPEEMFNRTVNGLQRVALAETAVPVDGAAQALVWLSKHYRLGIISDTGWATGQVLRELLQRDGLLSHFTHLTFSDEFGRSKPHASLFSATLRGLDTAPDEAIHVGDLRHTDILGAQEAGMGTVRYAGINDDRDVGSPEADAVIKSYSDIVQYFAGLPHKRPFEKYVLNNNGSVR